MWSHKQLLKVVSHTPVEVERLTRHAEPPAWVDAVRHFVPAEQKLYTWWSYREPRLAGSDRGRRLDHIWVTPDLRGPQRCPRPPREARAGTSPRTTSR